MRILVWVNQCFISPKNYRHRLKFLAGEQNLITGIKRKMYEKLHDLVIWNTKQLSKRAAWPIHESFLTGACGHPTLLPPKHPLGGAIYVYKKADIPFSFIALSSRYRSMLVRCPLHGASSFSWFNYYWTLICTYIHTSTFLIA